ncbi:MAG: LCP family protein [Ruminococcus sp.]|nr:LCP family protein [Candidatus Copronaster equi]
MKEKIIDFVSKTILSIKKNPLKFVLIAVLAVGIIVAVILGIYTTKVLNKINRDTSSAAVSVNPEFEKEEIIDFKNYNSEDNQNQKQETEKNNSADTSKKSENFSNSLSAIYEMKNGKLHKVELTEQEMKKRAAEVQQKGDKSIEKNIKVQNDVWYSDNVYNFLIVGYDAGDSEQVMFEGMKYPRADCVMIASFNKVKKEFHLVSLSRATYVAIPGYDNRRLNTAYAYGGPSKLIETIELNYKIRIDDYAAVDFAGFKEIINAMGNITVPMSETEASFAFNKPTPAGTYELNGSQALRYVRLRKTDSDRARTGRQRRLIVRMFKKFKTMTVASDLAFFDKVSPYITTNMSNSEIIQKIPESQDYLKYKDIQAIIPQNATQLTVKDGKEVLILDWDDTTDYIHELLYSGVSHKTTSVRTF